MEPNQSAHADSLGLRFPLLIKRLLCDSMSLRWRSGDHIVVRMRYRCRDFNRRIAQLWPNALTALDCIGGSTGDGLG